LITFIGATSFSGSTLLDVVLGTGEKLFSCGEPYALFRPKIWKPHQYQIDCACGDPECSIWPIALKKGSDRLYEHIYSLGYNFIFDSSKNISWFKYQEKKSKKEIFIIKVLLFINILQIIYTHIIKETTSCLFRGISGIGIMIIL
jgi:hypothetical protein